MTATHRARLLTLEDLEALPEDEYRYELEEGVLVREPAPGALHMLVAQRLSNLLEAAAGTSVAVLHPGAWVLARGPDTVRSPDLAIVRLSRVEDLDDPVRPFPGAPDIAIEVLSPSNGRRQVRGKVADYLSAGTEVVWIVDPLSETVTTYRTLLAPHVLAGEDLLDGGTILPDLRIRCREVFDVPGRKR